MPSKNPKHPIFVVYVTYNGSSKEYAYLCNFPAKQGDTVIANGQPVTIRRTAGSDPVAFRHVHPLPDARQEARRERRKEITQRLRELEHEQKQLELWQALAKKNPEAKKLLLELRRLG